MSRATSAALSPYVAGAGIGALSWLAFATAKKPIGVTTAFESSAAGLAQSLAPSAKLDIKPLQLGGIVGGGALFGAGLAVLGYCPGTTLAAIGEGRQDAMVGALGMLAGAGLFVRAYPSIEPLIKAGDHGKTMLPRVGASPWPWVAGLAAAVGASALIDRPAEPSLFR